PENPDLRGGIFSFNLEGWNCHDIGILLDETENIMVRTGRLCVHSWFSDRGVDGCIRASMYLYNTETEMECLARTIKKITG
ncbi:MAG: aminotransferase class V-fold PLP-dependent enzyme, partial [Thermoplasmata archaeon]